MRVGIKTNCNHGGGLAPGSGRARVCMCDRIMESQKRMMVGDVMAEKRDSGADNENANRRVSQQPEGQVVR